MLRVAAAYVVASWVLLQVADLLSPILDLPTWSSKLVFFVLLIGFVPSLILGWAYDLTTDGVEVTASPNGIPASSLGGPIVLAVAVVVIGLVIGAYWYSGQDARWARSKAMPAIEELLENGDSEAAFSLAMQVESAIPNDAEMADIWDTFSWTTSIPSDPQGATVYRRAYNNPDAEWQELGVTPLYDIRVPFGPSVLRLEAPGYLPLLRVIGGGMATLANLSVQKVPSADFVTVNPELFQLETESSIPGDMVRVPQGTASIDDHSVTFRSFLLGRHEVTNREFQKFVDAGGYSRRDLWEHEFVGDEGVLSFDDAMAVFIDSSGRTGPSTWVAGTYRSGEDDFPVAGVSWYEAAAYARFVGRELPTIHHWRRAFAVALLAFELPASNVDRDGIRPVGDNLGIGWTGTYDMLGNVREWCFNSTEDGQKVIVGGAWDDAPYMVEQGVAAPFRMPALDRAPMNGLRLATTNDESSVVDATRAAVVDVGPAPIPEPVSDEVFTAKLSDFEYDHTALNAEIEMTIESRHWTRQRISIDSANGEERIPIYLYLPKRESSRHQALLYWPGAATQILDSVDDTAFQLSFVLRNGRAVAIPVLKGMYERRFAARPSWRTHAGRNLAIEQVREFRRVIDYLETRADIESDNLGYAGFSWGGRVGAIVLAVEDRFKVAVLNQAGINTRDHADINVINFLPRVDTPVLHFSGLYDTDFRFETSSKPFFARLGTADQDKKHVVEPTGHFVDTTVVTGETLDWLDKYLGPVD